MNHTPGPWTIGHVYLDDEGYREVAIHATVDGLTVFPAAVCLTFPTRAGMQDANARLIAAAPDLLVAAREVLSKYDEAKMLEGIADDIPYFAALRAAVAKTCPAQVRDVQEPKA